MRFFAGILRGLFLVIMFAGSAAITEASLEYFDPDTLAPFIIERLPTVKFASLWLVSLKLHVVSALVAFTLCLMSTTQQLLFFSLHRSPPLNHRSPPLNHRSPPLNHRSPPLNHRSPPLNHRSLSGRSCESIRGSLNRSPCVSRKAIAFTRSASAA